MLGIALNSGRATVFDRDQHAARVRAVVRTGGVDDALHSKDYMGNEITGLISANRRHTRNSVGNVFRQSNNQGGGQIRPPRSLALIEGCYCPAGSTRTRAATTTGSPFAGFLKTSPRAIRFGVPACCNPARPSMFTKKV